MDLKTFFENFDTIAEAPGGIEKLRSLILDLAVRGKLVPQCIDDESALSLLNDCSKSSKSHKKSKKNDYSLPFDIPANWISVNLEQVAEKVHYGLTASANFDNHEYKFLRITDIQNNSVSWQSVPGCDVQREKAEKSKLRNGDIVIARTGGTVGKSYLVKGLQEEEFAVFASYLIRIAPIDPINRNYLKISLESPSYWIQLTGNISGTGQPNVNATSLKSFVLPIPPLAEQKRIVAKVDELMALCDRLQSAQEKRDRDRQKLRASSLDALMNAPTDDALDQAWAFVRDRWEDLNQKPDDVEDFRQVILQLAIEGKVESQNLNEEPASSIVLRAIEKRQNLIEAKKITKRKLQPPIEKEEIPIFMPLGWECVRLGEITDIASGVTKGRKLAGKTTGFFPYMRVANVQRWQLNLSVMKEIEIPVDELEKYQLIPGDVLLTEGGDWDKLGRSAIWNGEIPNCIHQNHVFRARSLDPGLLSRWIVMFTNSPIGRKYFESAAKRTTNLASINMTQLRFCPIPIPPEREQKRIVEKVDGLISLCDRLETNLRQSQEKASALAAAATANLEV